MTGQRWIACALVLCSLLISHWANASAPWLLSQQRADGAFAAAGDIATTFQATAEAVRALKAADPTRDVSSATAYLNADSYSGTEYLCRKITATVISGGSAPGLIQELLTRGNLDGGFGELRGYGSTPLDTAFAAEALAAAGQLGSSDAALAVGYLLRQQQANGSWQGPDGSPSVYTTALAVRALWAYRHRFDIAAAVTNGRNYLLAQRNTSALWNETHLSALALAAIAPTFDDRSVLQVSLAALAEAEQADGSYGDDVYTTALALQALTGAQRPFEDLISLRGRVVDGDSGAVLVGANVRITGPASAVLNTADDGTFRFESRQAGTYELAISFANYASVTASTTVRPGQSASFGDIALLRGDDAPTTAVLSGRVTDNTTGQPLMGVQVQIAGLGLTAISNANGDYQIGAIPPGAATIVASKDGYATVQGATTFIAGRIFNFSPQLSIVASTFVTVSGVVTDSQTSTALAGVTVTATTSGGSVSQLTDATGAYSIDNLAAGPLTVTAAIDGYHPVSGSTTASAGTTVTFSPALSTIDLPPPPPPATGAVAGFIVDSISGTPVSGATVQFVVGSTVRGTATTNVEGRFLIGNIIGAGELRISRSSYRAQTLAVSIAANTGVDVGAIELVPSSLAAGGAFKGVVIDALTNLPRSGVTVTAVFGTTTRTATTSAAGAFQITGLNPLTGTASLARTGYETAQLGLELSLGEIVDLGNVYLRPVNTDEVRGDLIVQSLDPRAIQTDANSFAVSGTLPLTFMNSGNDTLVGSIRVIAFSDGNLNGRFDAASEAVLGEIPRDIDLAPAGLAAATITLAGTLPFRDAPISVFLDADNVLIEQSEANNVDSTAGVCRNTQRLAVDLGLCMDSSGSISAADFQLQLQGTAAAIENPAIIPHDGSVRLTVMQFDSATRVELPPTILDSSNAATLAARIRGIRKSNGGTAIHSCINTATTQLSAALPKAAIRVIDLATDGASSRPLAEQAAASAQAAGIDALNALAVGSGVDLALLNAVVFPKTGPDAGFVVAIETFEQYAQAIADKIRREARTADLTIGRLQIKDEGSFVTLSVRVGNGGSRTVPAGAEVGFYSGDPAQGGTLLGKVTLPQLVTGEFIDINLANVTALTGGETIFAVADVDGVVGECNIDNNRIFSNAGLLRGGIQTSTDAPVYAPNSAVELRASISNLGSLAGTFGYRLQVEDAQGAVVAAFPPEVTDVIAAGGTLVRVQPWNTGNFLAGDYRLHGFLMLSDGSPLGEAVSQFRIAHDASTGPSASVRVGTDRPAYNTSDSVVIDTLVRNLTTATLMPDTKVKVTVRDPQGTVVLERIVTLGELVGGSTRDTQVSLTLTRAAEGAYGVVAEVLDDQNAVLVSGTHSFLVQEDVTLTLAGNIEVALRQLVSGETQTCTSNIRNGGTLNIGSQTLRVTLVDLSTPAEVRSDAFNVALAAGATHVDARSQATNGFASGDYACVLQAQVNGEWRTLDQEVFRVERPPIRLEASMTTGARGRLLVLMDGVGHWPCTRLNDIELWAPFRASLPRNARIDVELLDGNDRRVDFESVNLSEYRGSINRGRGNGADLTITGASPDVLTVKIGSNAGLGEGYRVVATATVDSLPPIRLETDVMGTSCGWHAGIGARFGDFHCSGGRSHHGGGLPGPIGTVPTLNAQRAFLEQLLETNQWSYKIVTDDEDFERELRSGAYSQYALFSEHEKLDEQVQKELREAIYRGEGLLDAGRHDHRSRKFDAALGIVPLGRHAYASGVQFNVPWMPAQTASLYLKHDALKVRLAGAQPAAEFVGVHSYDTAVSTYQYGRGRSIYAGYDLLAEATQAGATSLHAQLLKNALEQVRSSFDQVHASQVIPVKITVQNRGVATPGRVRLPLPAGVTLVERGSAQFADNTLTWNFDLAADAQTTVQALVRLPSQSGAVLFDATIQSGSGSAYVDQTHATLSLNSVPSASIAQVIESVRGNWHFLLVRFWLEKAQFWQARGHDYFALASLVQATDEVMRVPHLQADEVRLQIDAAIWDLSRQLD